MKKRILTFIFPLFALAVSANGPVVTNVTANQQNDLVVITYNLSHPNSLPCEISVEVSTDGGVSYAILPAALSGDIGTIAAPAAGADHQIDWQFGLDGIGSGDNYRVKVIADDLQGQIPENFVLVPGGTIHPTTGIYTAGLTVSDFYMDKHELTNAEWNAVMGSGGGDDYPHDWVSWFGAIEYCNRRSLQEGLTPCYSYLDYGTNPDDWPTGWNSITGNSLNVSCDWNATGYRLPSEAEWEYAARGGLQTHGYTYSGSNDLDLVGWYSGNSGYTSHPVGQLAANELGSYDMSGNLVEWVWDIHNGSYRVLRSGSFNYNASVCTVSYRVYGYASYTNGDLGFRICRSVPTATAVSTPQFDPPGGVYQGNQVVSITCATPDASIYYITDGSEPNESSLLYTGPISIGADATIKAKAYKTHWTPSEVSTAQYFFVPQNFVFVEGGTIHPTTGIYTGGLTVSDFYMDKYELTNAEWNAVMGSGGGDNYPHASVSWFGAIEYCNRRSLQEGLTPCYSYLTYGTNPDDWPSGWNTSDDNSLNVSCDWNATGYRLPSEAEWEYAARGGLQTHGYTYSGSNDLSLVGWCWSNSGNFPHPVGQLAPNELGTYDMSGNLWECCWDIYSDSYRVIRGGYFSSVSSYCTVWVRNAVYPTVSDVSLGFRICRVYP